MEAGYAHGHGPWSTPEDLGKATWLVSQRRPSIVDEWFKAKGLRPLQPRRIVSFEHLHMALGAAQAGMGVAIGTEYYVDGLLRDGRLIAPFGLTERMIPFYLAWPKLARRDPRVKRLGDWLEPEGSRTHS